MSGRYAGWRRLKGDTDRPDLLDLGKKMLAYLDNQRRLSGVSTLSIQRELPDGSVVMARYVGDLPEIMVKRSATAMQDLYGFVTWPTDADGNDVLPEEHRVILFGEELRRITQEKYAGVFPDGLHRAGNVDWRGKGGWVLSWYGPRGRYLDPSPPRKPFVFFKGQPILDLADVYPSGSSRWVWGCAVAQQGAGPWLIVFAVIDSVDKCVVAPISGRATDAEITIGDVTEIDSRTTPYPYTMGHPFYFNPKGINAKTIQRITNARWVERTATIHFEAGAPDSVSIEEEELANAEYLAQSGYTELSVVTAPFQTGRTWHVQVPLDAVADVLIWPPPDTPVNHGIFTVTAEVLATYEWQAAESITISWASAFTSSVEPSDWMKVAVDYDEDGNPVYAYGRPGTRTASSTGSEVPTTTAESMTGEPILSFDVEVVSGFLPGTANRSIDGSSVMTTPYLPGWSMSVEYAREEETHESFYQLKIGELVLGGSYTREFNASSTRTQSCEAVPSIPARHGSGSPGFLAYDASEVPSYGFRGVIGSNHTLGRLDPSRHHGFSAESAETETYDIEHIIAIDLRYGVVVSSRLQDAKKVNQELSGFADDVYAPEFEGPVDNGSVATTATTTTTSSWTTRCWKHGVLVFEHATPVHETEAVVTTTQTVFFQGPETPSRGNGRAPSDFYGFTCGAAFEDYAALAPDPDYVLTQWTPIGMSYDDGLVQSEVVTSVTYGMQVPATNSRNVDDDHAYQVSAEFGIAALPSIMWFGYGTATKLNSTSPAWDFRMDYSQDWRTNWHADADGVEHFGNAVFTKKNWVASLVLPSVKDTPYTYVSFAKAGDPLTKATNASSAAHLFPVWLLAPTNKPI